MWKCARDQISSNDAVAVTWNLGSRFLWIDSICKVQDDEERHRSRDGEDAGHLSGSKHNNFGGLYSDK